VGAYYRQRWFDRRDVPAPRNFDRRAYAGGEPAQQYETPASAKHRHDMLERLLDAIQTHGNAQMVYADFYYVDEADRITGRTSPRVIDYRHLLVGNPGNMAFLYTKKAKQHAGEYDPELEGTEDWDMWLRMSERYLFAYLPEPLYFFREHPGSMTATMQPQIQKAEARTVAKALHRIKGRPNLFHLFPGLVDCKKSRVAMGAAHLQLGSLFLEAAAHKGLAPLGTNILLTATTELPNLPSAHLNLAAAHLLASQRSQSPVREKAKLAFEGALDALNRSILVKQIQANGLYLATLANLRSFLRGHNRTSRPAVIGEAQLKQELVGLPEKVLGEQCRTALAPYLIEVDTHYLKQLARDRRSYHKHAVAPKATCMQGCQGQMVSDKISVLDARARCTKICKAPGFVAASKCVVGQRGKALPRADGLSATSKASHRTAWRGSVTISALRGSGDSDSPLKVGVTIRGADLKDEGRATVLASCKQKSLANETCSTILSAVAGAVKEAVPSTGTDTDLEDPAATSSKLIVVTAATHDFFEALTNLVGSVHFWQNAVPVVVYDLGLTAAERQQIKSWQGVSLRSFNFAAHPAHVADLYNYAWKPLLLMDALKRAEGVVLYQDAGQEIRQPLDELAEVVAAQGHLFPSAGVPASSLSHPATLRYLGTSVEELDQAGARMVLGGSMALQMGSLVKKILQQAIQCAIEEACIAPPGATTKNHSFDQTVLSVLLQQAAVTPLNEWRWQAHDEIFYAENLQHRLPLANSPGRFKEVHPGSIVLYSRRTWDTPRPFATAVRKICAEN